MRLFWGNEQNVTRSSQMWKTRLKVGGIYITMKLIMLQVLLALGISRLAKGAPITSGHKLRNLANCLRMNVPQAANVTPNEVLNYIRNNYIIVPASNPPIPDQTTLTVRPARRTRDVGTPVATTVRNSKCPFTYEVQKNPNMVPLFVNYARCEGCDRKCKPVTFTHQLLSHVSHCNKVWVWTQRTLPIAFVWVDKEWTPQR